MPPGTMPLMYQVRQRLHSAPLADVGAAVQAEFVRVGLSDRIRPGARIAITAGSRGIDRISHVICALTRAVAAAGGRPFVVPAMGSHGGATAAGQMALLESLGVTDDAVEAPILATMEVEQLGETPEGIPVFMDRYAAGADGILVVNRVRRHSDFSGRIESGVLKMTAIGLGKRRQAEAVHIHGERGLREMIVPVARVSLERAPVLAGFALLEDGSHRLARVVGLRPDGIEAAESRLLRWSKRVMPRIPFDDLDVLIVDRVGKHLSGTGMDTKVIGRMRIPGARELSRPRVRVLIARELSPESHGNGVGVGLADIVTRRFVDAIDWRVTNTNTWTSGFLERSKVGFVAADEAEALDTAFYLVRDRGPRDLRVVRISDTLNLAEMEVSEALLARVSQVREMTVVGGPWPLLSALATPIAAASCSGQGVAGARPGSGSRHGTRGTD